MADKWEKGGSDTDNVHSGPGSKGKGRSVGGSSRGGDAGSATVKTHDVEFAKGGTTKMFGEQEAGDNTNTGETGKPDERGPGEKFASGGTTKMFGFQGAVPARDGITSAR